MPELVGLDRLNTILKSKMRVRTEHEGGRWFEFTEQPSRIIVVYLRQSTEEFQAEVITRILALRNEWILARRFGDASDLDFVSKSSEGEIAISFAAEEHLLLARFLSAYVFEYAVYSDLWLFPSSADVLLSWDHHARTEEGLDIQLQSVQDASSTLVSLNELGAELGLIPVR